MNQALEIFVAGLVGVFASMALLYLCIRLIARLVRLLPEKADRQ